MADQGAGNGDALALPARKVSAMLRQAGVQPAGKPFHQIPQADLVNDAPDLLIRSPRCGIGDIIPQGTGEQDGVLRDHSQLTAVAFQFHLRQIDAVHRDPTGIRLDKPHEQAEQSAFAGTAGPHDGHAAPRRHPQGKVPQDRTGGIGITVGHALKADFPPQRRGSRNLSVGFHLVCLHDLIDAGEGFQAPGQGGEKVDHRRNDLAEIVLIEHHFTGTDDPPVSQRTGKPQADHLEELKNHPAGGPKNRVGGIQAESRILDPGQQMVHPFCFPVSQTIGPGNGDHFQHFAHRGLGLFHLPPETAVGAADGTAESPHRASCHRHRQQIQPEDARVIEGSDHHRRRNAGDQRHQCAETGTEHLLHIFHVPHNLGEKPSRLGTGMELHRQMLELVHHGPPQFHLDAAGQAGVRPGMQPGCKNVLRHKKAAHRQVDPEFSHGMVCGVGHDVDDIGGDHRRHVGGRMLDDKPEHRPEKLSPMAVVKCRDLTQCAHGHRMSSMFPVFHHKSPISSWSSRAAPPTA